jgi:hypothetical protein
LNDSESLTPANLPKFTHLIWHNAQNTACHKPSPQASTASTHNTTRDCACWLTHLLAKQSSTCESLQKRDTDKKQEIRVISEQRSRVLNIGLTKLPPPRAIKQAILKFDSMILNKECLEKIIREMLPTEDEKVCTHMCMRSA